MMLEQIARYVIGALVGALLTVLAMLSWHYRQMDAWESAAREQQAAEAVRIAKHNERIVYGWAAAVAELRRRLDAGWRPRIPRDVSAAGVPGATGRPDGRPADPVPAAGGPPSIAAGPPNITAAAPNIAGGPPNIESDLRECRADLDRLIRDGAETALQVRAWQSWAMGINRGPGDSAR